MNRYFDYLRHEARHTEKVGFNMFHAFHAEKSPDFYMEHLNSDLYSYSQKSSIASVKIYDSIVVKCDVRPARKRIKSKIIFVDPCYGLQGMIGEAINTLVVNNKGLPSHQLQACIYNPWLRSSALFFKRIQSRVVADLLTDFEVHDLLHVVFDFLYLILEGGVFHGDCNLSNIMANNALEDIKFIDFQVAINRQCDMETGLALQLCSLRDWRLSPYISEDDYRELVFVYFERKFHSLSVVEAIFHRFYGHRLGSSERRARLSMAALGSAALDAVKI